MILSSCGGGGEVGNSICGGLYCSYSRYGGGAVGNSICGLLLLLSLLRLRFSKHGQIPGMRYCVTSVCTIIINQQKHRPYEEYNTKHKDQLSHMIRRHLVLVKTR